MSEENHRDNKFSQTEISLDSDLAKWMHDAVEDAAEEISGYGNDLSYSLRGMAKRKRTPHYRLLSRIAELPNFSGEHIDLYVARLIFDLAIDIYDPEVRKRTFLCDFLLDEAEKRMPTKGFFHNSMQKERNSLVLKMMSVRERTRTYIQQRLVETGYEKMMPDELMAGKTPAEKAHAAEAA